MRVLLSHVYSKDNKGDAALLAALIADVKRAFGDPEMVALTFDEIEPGESFEGVPLREAFMYHALNAARLKALKMAAGVFVVTATLAWAVASRLHVRLPLPAQLESLCRLYRDADLVVTVGGGFLRARPGWLSTLWLVPVVHPFWLAAVLGTPTVLYPQSIGPLGNPAQERLVRHTLDRAALVLVREDVSMEVLRRLRVRAPVARAVDGAFALPAAVRPRHSGQASSSNGDRPLFGITVRAWLDRGRQSAYERGVAGLADHLVSTGSRVVFIPQVSSTHHHDDDREVATRVRSLMRATDGADVVTDDLDYLAVKELCGSVDYMVGTRFHSVIFALCAHVPAIAIEYEHKTSGIMRELGLERWVIAIEDVTTPRLVALVGELVAARDGYELHLDEVIPPYARRAAATYEQLVVVGSRLGLVPVGSDQARSEAAPA